MCNVEYQYLRPKKAAQLQQWHEAPFIQRESLQCWQGKDATILPLRQLPEDNLVFGRGGVVDKEGQYVSLSQLDYRVQFGYPFEGSRYQDKKVVYCGYMVPHWGHFLVEAVARLWYFLEEDPSVDSYVFILKEHEQREITGNFQEFLKLLGIWEKLEWISEPTTFREVIVPELAFDVKHYYSPKFLDIFDRVIENAPVDPSWKPVDKFYMTRTQLTQNSQTQIGFEALDHFFEKNGYALLAPEKIPLSQMIYYIRNATSIASICGTLPHNMLFARNGQTIHILERGVLNNEFQVHVNQLRQLHATYIDANFAFYTVAIPGPYIMGYTPKMEAFAQDHQMQPPDERFISKSYWKSCFVRYMKEYRNIYGFHWFMQQWYVPCMDYLFEAYQDSAQYFSDYLTGSRPFLPEHYFQWHYWKQFVKRILRKVGLQ